MTLKTYTPKILILLLMLLLGTVLVQAQDDVTPGDSPTAISTAIASVEPTSAPANSSTQTNANPPAQASPVEQAVANLINSIPSLFVYSVLFGMCIYLIRERRELTKLLAGAIGPDMATNIVDTVVKGALSMLEAAARAIPGQADDKQVESLAREAGLVRVINPDGSRGWKPIEGAVVPTYTASSVSNEDLLEKLAQERGLQYSKTQNPGGSITYNLTLGSAG